MTLLEALDQPHSDAAARVIALAARKCAEGQPRAVERSGREVGDIANEVYIRALAGRITVPTSIVERGDEAAARRFVCGVVAKICLEWKKRRTLQLPAPENIDLFLAPISTGIGVSEIVDRLEELVQTAEADQGALREFLDDKISGVGASDVAPSFSPPERKREVDRRLARNMRARNALREALVIVMNREESVDELDCILLRWLEPDPRGRKKK